MEFVIKVSLHSGENDHFSSRLAENSNQFFPPSGKYTLQFPQHGNLELYKVLSTLWILSIFSQQ